jgi:hypothetical protein
MGSDPALATERISRFKSLESGKFHAAVQQRAMLRCGIVNLALGVVTATH